MIDVFRVKPSQVDLPRRIRLRTNPSYTVNPEEGEGEREEIKAHDESLYEHGHLNETLTNSIVLDWECTIVHLHGNDNLIMSNEPGQRM